MSLKCDKYYSHFYSHIFMMKSTNWYISFVDV